MDIDLADVTRAYDLSNMEHIEILKGFETENVLIYHFHGQILSRQI